MSVGEGTIASVHTALEIAESGQLPFLGSLESFAGGVAYMAQRAGADWQPPDPALLERIESEVRKREARRKTKSGQGY